jgi:signal peptidase II
MQRLNSLQGSWERLKLPCLIAISLIVLDQISKLLIRHYLSLGESVPAEGVFRFTYVANEGGIFGISVPQALPIIFSTLIVIAAVYICYRYSLFESRLAQVSLGFIISGSIGNLVDRIHLGYVVDFIDVRLWGEFHWPAFNVADSSIVIGVILLAYFLIRSLEFEKHS